MIYHRRQATHASSQQMLTTNMFTILRRGKDLQNEGISMLIASMTEWITKSDNCQMPSSVHLAATVGVLDGSMSPCKMEIQSSSIRARSYWHSKINCNYSVQWSVNQWNEMCYIALDQHFKDEVIFSNDIQRVSTVFSPFSVARERIFYILS